MPLGTEVGLGPDDIVLDGDLTPPPQKGAEPPSPIFGPCLLSIWSMSIGWIKMAHIMEVSLGSGHIMLDVDPAPLFKKGA